MTGTGVDARIVLITHPVADASAFARSLVERRLAACVNLIPVRSIYRWRASVEEEGETLLVVKTSSTRLQELERVLRDEHPYEVVELVALAPSEVGEPYLAWLLAGVE